MTTIEHLQRIKSRCQELLATAEKRTPGRWHGEPGNDLIYRGKWVIAGAFDGEYVCKDCPIIPEEEQHNNAAFIASCAGPAEAGWRATIAAVDAVLMLNPVDLSPCDGGSCMVATSAEESLDMIRGCAASAIIAAWPEEVLA